MGKKFELKSAAEVESTAEALGEATASLTKVLMKMRDAKMETAHFPWTQRQWDSLDVIITLASQCEAVIQAQVVAHQQGRPSQFAVIKQRSGRNVRSRANSSEFPNGSPATFREFWNFLELLSICD